MGSRNVTPEPIDRTKRKRTHEYNFTGVIRRHNDLNRSQQTHNDKVQILYVRQNSVDYEEEGAQRHNNQYEGIPGKQKHAPQVEEEKFAKSACYFPRDKFVPASIEKSTPGGSGEMRQQPSPLTYTLSGDKYSYQPNREKWLKIPMKVAIERTPFSEGGMRLVYKCWEIVADNSRISSCAKVFKDGEGAQAYFDEAMTQTVADSYAQDFNRECYRRRLDYNVGFVPVCVLHLKTAEGKKLLYNVEPMLKGEYRKHNDNDGNVETNQLLPQAFSHYTYERSNKLLVIVDIQGVGSFYTDPQIHSFDGNGFGLGNMGMDGVTKFLKTHECNDICKFLELSAITIRETDYEMAKRLQEEENLLVQNPNRSDGFRKDSQLMFSSETYKE